MSRYEIETPQELAIVQRLRSIYSTNPEFQRAANKIAELQRELDDERQRHAELQCRCHAFFVAWDRCDDARGPADEIEKLREGCFDHV